MKLRVATHDDLPLLRAALLMAYNWRGDSRFSEYDMLADLHSRRYLDGWKRVGDEGIVAVDGSRPDSPPRGVVWTRLMTAEEPGYGFVAEDIPELSMAVWEGHRGCGVGGALVSALLNRGIDASWRGISLSVEEGNTAARALYQRHGFKPVGRRGNSDTMLITF